MKYYIVPLIFDIMVYTRTMVTTTLVDCGSLVPRPYEKWPGIFHGFNCYTHYARNHTVRIELQLGARPVCRRTCNNYSAVHF